MFLHFGDGCQSASDCGSGNLVCVDGACVCKDPYFEHNGECIEGKSNVDCALLTEHHSLDYRALQHSALPLT